VIVPLLLSITSLIGFTIWEKVHRFPLLDPSVWNNTNFTLCVLCTMFGYMSFVTNQFWIPLYMQEVQHFASLHIALLMLPQALSGFLWSYLVTILIHRIDGKTIMAIGGLAYLVGALLLIFIRPDTSYWRFLFPAMVITVIGADFQFVVANVCFQVTFSQYL
jgi:nitrate/nitrite transporter NarK